MKYGKKLSDEVSISELLQLRQEGLTNKQIADRLEVSPVTIYRYIGKRSAEVKKAEEQNKPCPVTPKREMHQEQRHERNEEASERQNYEHIPAHQKPALKVIRDARVMDLQGILCVFHADTSTNTVELKDDANGTLVGLMNVSDIPLFIEELKEVYEMMHERASA